MNNLKSRIVLADDSRFFRTIERQFLQRTPAVIDEVADSDQLFTQLRDNCPQLLIVGFALRPHDGAECCRRIKSDPALRSLPVIVVCDQHDTRQADAARRAGADSILVKPLDRTSFLKAGRQYLASIREYRHPCFMAVQFAWEGEALTGKCLDISSGGLYLETSRDIPVGTRLSLRFTLPDSSVALECEGDVMWLNRKPDLMKPHYPKGLGIRFHLPGALVGSEVARFMKF